jgi:hypothetical protein
VCCGWLNDDQGASFFQEPLASTTTALQTVSATQTIPVKFNLTANYGLSVIKSFSYTTLQCSDLAGASEVSAPLGNSTETLKYDDRTKLYSTNFRVGVGGHPMGWGGGHQGLPC